MDFGFTLKPDHDIERFIALTRQAEAAGFSYGWLFDNHVPFREVYPLLTLMALNTTRMRLGTCVTNPATRDPSVTASALATLDEISGGRMDLGIGRGDSSVPLARQASYLDEDPGAGGDGHPRTRRGPHDRPRGR
jgi:alkanesulfonate monooxygenase SsuD/methylene tetrahydromethanopterin reductase-like flavin-dependent oxidoreductase (luciferase family)